MRADCEETLAPGYTVLDDIDGGCRAGAERQSLAPLPRRAAARLQIEIATVFVLWDAVAHICRRRYPVFGTGGRWFEPTQLYRSSTAANLEISGAVASSFARLRSASLHAIADLHEKPG